MPLFLMVYWDENSLFVTDGLPEANAYRSLPDNLMALHPNFIPPDKFPLENSKGCFALVSEAKGAGLYE